MNAPASRPAGFADVGYAEALGRARGLVPALREHPLRRLMQAGIRCTVSTDDPLCFANSITEEYAALARELAFTPAELGQIARNGWEVADVPAATRTAMLQVIDRLTGRPP